MTSHEPINEIPEAASADSSGLLQSAQLRLGQAAEDIGNWLGNGYRKAAAGLAAGAIAIGGPAVVMESVAYGDSSGQLPGSNGPYDGNWDPSNDNNLTVQTCQQAAINNIPYYSEIFVSSSPTVSDRLGSRSVKLNLDLTRLIAWVGYNEYLYSCGQVTTTTVDVQAVEKVKDSKHPHRTVTKAVGSIIPVQGDGKVNINTDGFDGNLSEVAHTQETLKLPRPLTRNDVSRRDVGVSYTIVSQPKLQKPTAQIPGPMVTLTKQHIVWAK